MKAVEEQIQAMAGLWPELRLASVADRAAQWEGPLVPTKKAYRVRVSYRARPLIEAATLSAVQPLVQVMTPRLERHPDYEDGPIPHIYPNREDQSLPFLCLFDPSSREWDPSNLIAETAIPWAARGLFFYEGWLLTKKWFGGGRHPSRSPGQATVPEKQLETV